LDTPVIGGAVDPRGLIIETGGVSPWRIAARLVVNAAGLGAQAVARSIFGMPSEMVPPLHLAKGNYFSLATRSPFSHLIYPMPTEGGLGVHLTLDLAGRARFGPDVEWIKAVDYAVDPKRAESFYAAIRSIGRTCPTARCRRTIRASGRRSPGPAGPPSTFSSRRKDITASVA
jgi:L-2-hydroxyglutarate oxidase LhgO